MIHTVHLLILIENDVLKGVSISHEGIFLHVLDGVGVEVELSEAVKRSEGVARNVV